MHGTSEFKPQGQVTQSWTHIATYHPCELQQWLKSSHLQIKNDHVQAHEAIVRIR